MEAFREIFWNIGIIGPIVLYTLGVATLALSFMRYTDDTDYGIWENLTTG